MSFEFFTSTLRTLGVTFVAICSISSAAQEREPLPVISNLDNMEWAGKLAAQEIDQSLYNKIVENKLAAEIVTYSFTSKEYIYCTAKIGLTTKPSNNIKQPRTPMTIWSAGHAIQKSKDQGKEDCSTIAIKKVISVFSTNLKDINIINAAAKTTDDGLKQKIENDLSQMYILFSGIGQKGKDYIFNTIPQTATIALNPNLYQYTVDYSDLNLEGGLAVCTAEFGITSRAPEGLNPRKPIFKNVFGRLEFNKNSETSCNNEVFYSLFKQVIDSIITDTELPRLAIDFDRVAEPWNYPLPTQESLRKALAQANQDITARKLKLEQEQLARLAKFRASLKVGSETNCGPVIELKGPMVQVARPVKDYGNAHWIRLDDLFMPGSDCSFYNGVYQKPKS